MPATTIAIANQKGGVGKTTTTINLGAALASFGIPTLLVDMDPQGNATSSLGIEKKAGAGVYEPLLTRADLSSRVVATNEKNLWIIPSELDLAAAELELSSQDNYLINLRDSLHNLSNNYGLQAILIDCPPTLGLLSMNSLCAADYLLITLQSEYLALEGLSQITKVIEQLKQSGANSGIQLGGIAMTMYDNRTRLSYEVWQEVNKHYPAEIFRTAIPRTVRLSEAPSFGKTIFQYDPNGVGSKAYLALAKEVRTRFFS
jgi:chromosome partitioning protein|tara:strand:- start:783 stop:1559 length:777 start_codon:yes stop_codon:yes gene_type:complete